MRSQPPCEQSCRPGPHPASCVGQGGLLWVIAVQRAVALWPPAVQVGTCICRYLGPDYGDERKGPSEAVSAAQIPYLAKESFPLCMQASLPHHRAHAGLHC